MAELQSWTYLLKTLSLVVVFGIYGVFLFVKKLVLAGPKAFFYYRERNIRPSILDGSAYGEHVFVRLKRSRTKIHCVVDGPKGSPLMLFLHGFPEFWYSWRHQIKEFNKKYRTVAIDMRGYGESDKPQGVHNYEISLLANDVDELITLLGYSSCILVAHDWGGAVAWKFVADHPDKVDRMIIGNLPHPLAFKEHINSCLSQVMKSWYIFFFQLPMLPIYFLLQNDLDFLTRAFTKKRLGAKQGTFTEEDIECFKYTFAGYGDICGPVNYYRAAIRYKPDSSGMARKFNKPILLIWGTADGALESKMAEMSKKYAENLRVEYIEGASHWVQQEYPAEFNAYMEDFLSQ